MELTRRIIELLDQGVTEARRRKHASRQADDAVGQVEFGD